MRECDGVHSSQDVGGFGVSSIEALSTGNIVLSLNHHVDERFLINGFPIINLKNEEKFNQIIAELIHKDKKELLDIANRSFEYFTKHISYHSTYNLFIQTFETL